MKEARAIRVLRPSLALAALAAVLVLLGLAIAGPAHAATMTPSPAATPSGAVVVQRDDVVRFGEDITVPRGTVVPSAGAFGGDITVDGTVTGAVVAFGGDITVDGTVTDAVVAFGGDVIINGTVGTSTFAFGGDVTVGPTAVLGRDLASTDAALVLFGGDLTQAPGAQVTGQTKTFKGFGWANAGSWAAKGMLFNPLLGLSFFGWVVQTVFFLVLALVAAALMPNQLRSVHRHLGSKPWPSLGWGALLFFVIVPAVLFVLVISIVGLLLVVPYGLFVLLAYFFVTTGVASFLAQKVLTGFGGKENLMLAVTIGVVGTTVVSRIPVAGPVLVSVMMIFGAGAAALGVAEWRRGKRQQAAGVAAANAAAATAAQGATAYPGWVSATGAPATVITPIVQTSPALPAEAPGASGTAVTQAGVTQATVAPPVAPESAPVSAPPVAPEAPPAVAPPAAPEAAPAAAPEEASAEAGETHEAAPEGDEAGPAPA